MLRVTAFSLAVGYGSAYQFTLQPGSFAAASAVSTPAAVAHAAAPRGALLRSAAPTMVVPAIEVPTGAETNSGEFRAKKVFVLGGDGFCGWPTALHLADKGHEVVIVDNLSRRKIDVEMGCSSLTPITSIDTRVSVWNELNPSKPVRFEYVDLATEYDRFAAMLKEEAPDTIVHFAEQRAAPYSMKNAATKRYTIENNLGATHNVLCAIVE
jgi:hypothetical protein